MRKQRKSLRTFHYFKIGYVTYLALTIGAINLLTTTYFLAIDEMPFIKTLFSTFETYVITAIIVGVPIVTVIGWIHFKRIGAFSAAQSIMMQNQIFNYKFQPGYTLEVFGPAYLAILRIAVKRIKSEKLSDDEVKDIDKIQKQLQKLIDGGAVGKYAKGVIDD